MRDKPCSERIYNEWKSRLADLNTFMNRRDYNEPNEGDDEDDLGPFSEYGLSFDYVAAYTFKDQDAGYFRYQFSWGGPSDELRFFKSGRVEYWFMDWFDGAHLDVSREKAVEWVEQFFEDVDSINWARAAEEDLESIDDPDNRYAPREDEEFELEDEDAVREAFWDENPGLDRKKIKDHAGTGRMYKTDTRVAFSDWLEAARRNGRLSDDLAQDVTLDE